MEERMVVVGRNVAVVAIASGGEFDAARVVVTGGDAETLAGGMAAARAVRSVRAIRLVDVQRRRQQAERPREEQHEELWTEVELAKSAQHGAGS